MSLTEPASASAPVGARSVQGIARATGSLGAERGGEGPQDAADPAKAHNEEWAQSRAETARGGRGVSARSPSRRTAVSGKPARPRIATATAAPITGPRHSSAAVARMGKRPDDTMDESNGLGGPDGLDGSSGAGVASGQRGESGAKSANGSTANLEGSSNNAKPTTGSGGAPAAAGGPDSEGSSAKSSGEASGLEVEKLRKSFRSRLVIREVTLRLDRGEAVGLLGPNGSGKTTSFYAIAGLIIPDEGRVTIDGRDVTGLPMYRRARLGIGYLPQEMSIFRGLSVEANIKAVLDITVRSPRHRRERLEELLSDFSIEHLRRSPALALSGGERRRVEIARCLASNPNYLLLDEPFAGVDPISVGEVRHLVADLKKRGLGVLITDHNVRETLDIVDRAYVMHDGQVLMSGTPDEVVRDENVRRVYLGDTFRFEQEPPTGA